MGLRGNSLRIAIALVGAVAFMLQGYGQAVYNGIVTLEDFLETFPKMDTITTTGAEKKDNAHTEGTSSTL
jgi:hypothetical protein